MAGGWGATKNGVKIGVFWDSIVVTSDGTQAHLVNPRVSIFRSITLTDTTNKLSVAGAAVTDDSWSNLSLSGSGEAVIKAVSYQLNTLTSTTKTATFSATLAGVGASADTLTVSQTITFPAKTTAPPLPPGPMTATRISDNKVSLVWGYTSTSAAPWLSWSIQRWDNVTATWTTIISVSDPVLATSYVDNTTVPNRQYQYRIRSGNQAGTSTWTTANLVTMTPTAPSNAAASKSGSDITVTWTNNHVYGTGVQVWHAANGIWDASPLATVEPKTATYTHIGASNTATHQYRVRVAATGPLYSNYATTGVVTLLVEPLAPSVSVSAAVADLTTTAIVVSFTHNPVDSTTQTDADLRYRKTGDTAWTTVSEGTATSHTFAAGSLENGATYEVQVRTKGGYPSYGPYSASTLFVASAKPTVTITDPVDTELDTSVLQLSWIYFDTDGSTQSGWRVQLRDVTGTVIHNVTVDNNSSTYTVPVVLQDGMTYYLSVWVRDGSGLWSDPALLNLNAKFLPPPASVVTGEFNEDNGSVLLSIRTPVASEDLEVPATSQTVQRWDADKWVTVQSDIPIASAIILADRINLASDPAAARTGSAGDLSSLSGRLGWATQSYGDGGSGLWEWMDEGNGPVPFLDTYLRKEWTSDGFGEGLGFTNSRADIQGYEVSEGDDYTISSYLRANMSSPAIWRIRVAFLDNSGVELDSFTSDLSNLVADQWRRFWITVTVPEMATIMSVSTENSEATIPEGMKLDGTGLLVELGSTLGTYFDGDMPEPDIDTVYSWEGEPNDSQSTELRTKLTPILVTDPIPQLMEIVQYRVLTWSSTPTSAESNHVYVDTSEMCWAYLNGGPGWSKQAKLKGSPTLSIVTERDKNLHTFAGREKPIEFIGDSRDLTLKVSGLASGVSGPLLSALGPWTDWIVTMANLPAPLCYRDPRGVRKFCSIGSVTVTPSSEMQVASVSFSLTEVEYDE